MKMDLAMRRGALLIVLLGLASGAWRAVGAGTQDPAEDVPSMDANDVPGNTPLAAAGPDSSPLSQRLSFKIEPSAIVAGWPITVRFRVYSSDSGPKTKLTVESVDASGRGIATEAELFDDGTHGDTKASDKTYTFEKRLGPLDAGRVRFRARFVDDGKTEISRVVAVAVIDDSSDEGQQVTAGEISGAALVEYKRLRESMAREQAARGTLDWVRRVPLVASAEIDTESATILVRFRNGLRSTVSIRD
jgi:hypothetical protein